MPEASEERALVERARKGDPAAFGELYQRHWASVYLHVAKELPDMDEAASTAQEAFTQAWLGIGSLKNVDAFPGFIKTISIRLARDARMRRPRVVADPPDRRDPSAPDPARAAERSEFDAAMLAALADFEPIHRDAVVLRLVDGLKYREIAQRLGLSLGQAIGIVDRGILRLADRLEPFLGGEP